MRRLLMALLFVGLPAVVAAQDPCVSGGVDTLVTGQSFTVKWTVQQQVATSPSDPTPVAHRYNGTFLQIDTTPELDIPLTAEIGVCPVGTPRASDKIYSYRASGVQKGQHSVSLALWNWAPLLNPDGTPQLNADGSVKYSTTQKLRGDPVIIPFAATDAMQPTMLGKPYQPWNPRIIKQ